MTETTAGDPQLAGEQGFNDVLRREVLTDKSPRSPSTSGGSGSESLDLAMGFVAGASLEQLYNNVYEMQSSDHSPSRMSLLSYGEESRIDSELRFLAGGHYGAVDNAGEKKIPSSSPGKEISSPLKAGSKGNKIVTLSSKPLKGTQNGKERMKNVSKSRKEKSIGTNAHSERGYLGPYLLKQAKSIMALGDNPQKALALALRAKKVFEHSEDEKPNLDYVNCLHVLAALYCSIGRYSEAIPILERSIDIPLIDLDHRYALAKFSGCMQLGDTYAMVEQIEKSIFFYSVGLEIQRQVLGEKDPRYAEACSYVAVAHVQALQFDEAEKLCRKSIAILEENGLSSSPQGAEDRRLLGLICDAKGDYKGALEHYVLASMAVAANGQNVAVASIDCCIGDAYLSMARYDEAIFAYQKALNMFKTHTGEDHPSVASVSVRLADVYNKIGKLTESKSCCENALRIYYKPIPGAPVEEIASGLVAVSALYESSNEPEKALNLLRQALEKYNHVEGHLSISAGIEAQMGVLHFILGNYNESYSYLKSAISKFGSIGGKKSALFGIALNQMGLACVQLLAINEAADLFEESRGILEEECGPFHADTLGVYSNLAGIYDAMGRTSDAIEILGYIIELREEKLGTANSTTEDIKRRLEELLKEAGFTRKKKSRSLQALFAKNSRSCDQHNIQVSR